MNIVRRSHDHRALCRAGLLFDLLVQLLVLWACSHRMKPTAFARGFGLAARRFAAVAHARLAARRYYATC
jgi:hypothetical protein